MALDPLFGLHADALSIQRRRMDVLAGNIANSDTPGFKARDIDFAATLQQAIGAGDGTAALAATSSGASITQAAAPSADGLVWRVPMQNSTDGNSVDAQIEQAKFADAALHYQASLNFIDGRVKGLMTAITGQ